MRIALLFLPALALAQTPTTVPPPTPAPFVTHKLSAKVYYVEGGGGSSAVIVGKKGVVVVDVKTTAAGGKELLESIAKITPLPVTTVIETHSDGDHVNGLVSFPKGITVIAHENCKKEEEAVIASGRGVLTAERLPTRVVSKDREVLQLEGEKFELLHWGPAHTNGDMIVYLPAEKIVFVGDIISPQQPWPIIHPEKNGSTEGWLRTTRGMAALNSDQFIPGHGDVQTKAMIRKQLADAEARRAKIQELVGQGKSLEEIRTAVGDPPARPRFVSYTEAVYAEVTKK